MRENKAQRKKCAMLARDGTRTIHQLGRGMGTVTVTDGSKRGHGNVVEAVPSVAVDAAVYEPGVEVVDEPSAAVVEVDQPVVSGLVEVDQPVVPVLVEVDQPVVAVLVEVDQPVVPVLAEVELSGNVVEAVPSVAVDAAVYEPGVEVVDEPSTAVVEVDQPVVPGLVEVDQPVVPVLVEVDQPVVPVLVAVELSGNVVEAVPSVAVDEELPSDGVVDKSTKTLFISLMNTSINSPDFVELLPLAVDVSVAVKHEYPDRQG
uniref:Zonadhesin n=1 Tax=Panagrellus redivivus TaxID=6233 RepID=A0A7E4ZXW3_PANRE